MPAHSPEEVHTLFAQYFSAGDLDAIMSLYEPEATLVPEPGVTVSGQQAIREALGGFLAIKGEFNLQHRQTFRTNDIALLFSDWTLKGIDPSGNPVLLAGQTSDVVRRQTDNSWRLVIDNPNGAASIE
jgi:ketosteroid isomerase-like protein